MRTFIRMFLVALVFMIGACAKQAPKQQKKEEIEIIIARLNIIIPQELENDKDYDPQDFDNEF